MLVTSLCLFIFAIIFIRLFWCIIYIYIKIFNGMNKENVSKAFKTVKVSNRELETLVNSRVQ